MGQPAAPGIAATWRRSRAALAAGALLALAGPLALAGCGGADSGSEPAASTPSVEWTLVLDYQPNAVHAGLLRAEQAGYFDDAGIELEIVAPSSTSDPLTQVARGKADLGLADLIDVARRNDRALEAGSKDASDTPAASPAAAEDRRTLALIGAIVQRPMSGILVNAASPITRPEQLRGKKIAVTGLPSDDAVVDAIVNSGAGAKIKPESITLGFNGLKALDAGRVDGATAYWPADSVTLEQLGTKPRIFALDEFGGPRYPGLVAFTSARLAQQAPQRLAAFQDALARGTADVVGSAALGSEAVAAAYPELDAQVTERQLERLLPLMGPAPQAGRVDHDALVAFAKFAADAGLTSKQLTPAEFGLTGAR